MGSGTFALILFSVTLSALAQVCFKSGMSRPGLLGSPSEVRSISGLIFVLTSPGVLGGLTLYGVGTLLWLQVLARVDLAQAYPFVGLGFVITTLFGVFLFGETITALRLAGIGLVVLGIWAIARG